jgi:fibronectin type 3 domain-containing protein
MARTFVVVPLVLVAMTAFLIGCSDSTTTEPNLESQAPITAPVDVTAQVTADGVELTWGASSHPDLRGYNVYRIDLRNGTTEQLTPAAIGATHYLDTTAQWRTQYEYRVTSVGSGSKESGYSAIDIGFYTSGGDTEKDVEHERF